MWKYHIGGFVVSIINASIDLWQTLAVFCIKILMIYIIAWKIYGAYVQGAVSLQYSEAVTYFLVNNRTEQIKTSLLLVLILVTVVHHYANIDVWAEDRSNSIANAPKLLQSCAKLSIYASGLIRYYLSSMTKCVVIPRMDDRHIQKILLHLENRQLDYWKTHNCNRNIKIDNKSIRSIKCRIQAIISSLILYSYQKMVEFENYECNAV